MVNKSLILLLFGVVLTIPYVRSNENLTCYVCNSHEHIDDKDCASSDKRKLEPFKVKCNEQDKDGSNNAFLKKIYGDLEIKEDPETGSDHTDGWYKKLEKIHGARDKGTTENKPPPLHIRHANFRIIDNAGETKGKEKPYDTCRILNIQTPDTTTKKKQTKDGHGEALVVKTGITKDNPRIVRLCGRSKSEDPKEGSCKDYRSRGGSTHTCTCKGDLCNGAPGIATASKLIIASLGILYIVFF